MSVLQVRTDDVKDATWLNGLGRLLQLGEERLEILDVSSR
jgi:hypothetical protein